MAAESALALVPSPTDTVKALGNLLSAREKVLEQIRKHDAEYQAKRNAQVRDLAAEAVKSFNMQNVVNRQTQLQTMDDQYKKEAEALNTLVAKFDELIEGHLKEAPVEARQLLEAKLGDLNERKKEDADAFEGQIKKLRGWLKRLPQPRAEDESKKDGRKPPRGRRKLKTKTKSTKKKP